MSPPRDRAQALETNGYTSDGGAGLEIFGDDSNGTSPVTQNGNVFEDNVLTSPPGASNDYFGGGEYAQNVDLQSTDDTFTQNELPGTSDGDYDEGVPAIPSAQVSLWSRSPCATRKATP